ncbi:hypothetical protein [Enhydrobacter sp.]|jgi:hypothetical protein|uniref:hypothetical protein n=1 Tax=Enhydrobacter sp. TaxID=1894999 RepID=UPI002620C644|nr:hypothetical protein [Enhydrobacter sp.]WIM14425.1 MAG: hypothetical protein OJF58_005395 [Enhydrobacter sp.]
MRYAPYLVLAALAGTVAACQPYYYRDGYRYGPNYAYAPGYSYPPSYGYSYYPSNNHYYTSKWDYYRHYNGISSPPERYP